MIVSAHRRSRAHRAWIALAALLMLAGGGRRVLAQPAVTPAETLRLAIERRFEVLPLQNGVALRPKSAASGVRSIELTDGTIAIDGTPATGGELRARLGADADVVLQLSYLDPAARRSLFARSAVDVERPPDAAATPPPPSPAPARTRRSDTRIRIGGNVTVDADEIVTDDVVVVGGTARIDGQVVGDVVVIGGTIRLGPHADVSKDVTVVGGTLERDPAARVGGKVNEVGTGQIDLSGLRRRNFPWRALSLGWAWGSAFALVSTLTRLAVLCLLTGLVLLVGREHVERIGARAAAEPLKAGAIGVLAQLLFLPLFIMTIVVLVVTIVGIPLLALIPFAILALALAMLLGFTAVAYHLGRVVSGRMGWPRDNPYTTTIVGILLVLAPAVLGRLIGLAGGILFPITVALIALGVLVEYLAWTVGFGAAALVRFDPPKTLQTGEGTVLGGTV